MIRLLDIIFSIFALLILAPLMLPIVAILFLTGEHEVFYIQERIGKEKKPFGLMKFATMLKESPNLGTGTLTVQNDPRILPFGRLLRKTKINELPQLINILKGEMSFVGPRPQTLRCFRAFAADVQDEIAKVRPGLSGIGSIIFRDEERLLCDSIDPVAFYDNVVAPYKGELEKWYVNNQGVKTYVFAIMVTIWVVVFSRSRIAWKIFDGIPNPPHNLASIV